MPWLVWRFRFSAGEGGKSSNKRTVIKAKKFKLHERKIFEESRRRAHEGSNEQRPPVRRERMALKRGGKK